MLTQTFELVQTDLQRRTATTFMQNSHQCCQEAAFGPNCRFMVAPALQGVEGRLHWYNSTCQVHRAHPVRGRRQFDSRHRGGLQCRHTESNRSCCVSVWSCAQSQSAPILRSPETTQRRGTTLSVALSHANGAVASKPIRQSKASSTHAYAPTAHGGGRKRPTLKQTAGAALVEAMPAFAKPATVQQSLQQATRDSNTCQGCHARRRALGLPNKLQATPQQAGLCQHAHQACHMQHLPVYFQ